MQSSSLRKFVFCYPANIVLAAGVWGSASAVIDDVIIPTIKEGASLALQIFETFVVVGSFFMLVAWIGCVILLFRKKWKHALFYFSAGGVLYISAIASAAIRGDKFLFTAGPHLEIADIYHQRRSELAPDKQQFFNLGEACHPPSDCDCWLLWDPNHSSVVNADIGSWHTPITNFFPQDSGFAVVDILRIDSNAFSVLGCSVDWRRAIEP
jgi:hypothetical protein